MIVYIVNLKDQVLAAMTGVTAVKMMQLNKAKVTVGIEDYFVNKLLRMERLDDGNIKLIVNAKDFEVGIISENRW
nr:MAG TPA: hypothetical protein [Caudoviricetes sp.]